MTKLAAAINGIHNRLKDAGESLSVGRKVSALIKSLKPKSKFANVIFEMKKTPWKSFTKAVARLQEVIKTWKQIRPEQKMAPEHIMRDDVPTSSSSGASTKGKWVPLDANNETLMFQRFKQFLAQGGRGSREGRGGRRGGRGNRGRGVIRSKRPRNGTVCYGCGGVGHYKRDCPTDSSYRNYLNFKSAMNNPNYPGVQWPQNKKQKVSVLDLTVSDDEVFVLIEESDTEDGMPPLSPIESKHSSKREIIDLTQSDDELNDEDDVLIEEESHDHENVNPHHDAPQHYIDATRSIACSNANVSAFGDEHERLFPMFLCAKNEDRNMHRLLSKPCMDSGASAHFFNELKSFQSLRSIPEVDVSLGEQGRSYQVNSKGIVRLKTKVCGRTHILTLKDVIFAPQAPGNFISLSCLDRMGMKTVIGDGCMAVFNKSGKLGAHAPLNVMTNLYDLSCEIVTNLNWQNDFAQFIDAPLRLNALTTSELMHRRFGHCGMQMLNSTLKKLKVAGLRSTKLRCTACDLTGTKRPMVQRARIKSKNANITKDVNVNAKDDIRALHSDVKTMPRSRRGYKFFAVFVEQLTRFCIVKLFKRKSELADSAMSSLNFVEKQGTCTIVEFRSDYESIYKCHKLVNYLDENGIKFSPSTPHRHEQNGIAERVIQTLLRKMRANLKQCGLTNHFWCYALDAAVHVYNRTLHGATNKIPVRISW